MEFEARRAKARFHRDKLNGGSATHYVSSLQNSSSPCFTALGSGFFGGMFPPAVGRGGSDLCGLLIDESAMLSNSSSSADGFLVNVGFVGGASFRGAAGAVGCGGFDEAAGLGAMAAGARLTFGIEASCVVIGFLAAVADQPHAVQVPLTFNASPHLLQSGIGWLESSIRDELITDFGAAELGRCGAAVR